jgi:hypothetical protein
MVVFFRRLHCCQAQLAELDRRLDELSARGIDGRAVSAEPRERSEQLLADWKLERLPIAYGLAQPSIREWRLFVSGTERRRTGRASMSRGFSSVSRTDYESILSMPAGRPRLDDLLHAIDYWTKVGYPARGDA